MAAVTVHSDFEAQENKILPFYNRDSKAYGGGSDRTGLEPCSFHDVTLNCPLQQVSQTPIIKRRSDPHISSINSKSWDFPGGPVVKKLLCNAGDDSGLIPGRGTKVAHAAEQLIPHATTRVCAPQPKIPCEATKIPCATTKI